MPGALDGLVVLDLTRILAGPLCTMWLGDMGAEVIKVEQPRGGDDTRAWGPPFVDAESAYFLAVNRNKRSVTLDLRTDAGVDLLRRLIARADVVVDNFKLGTFDRWGLDDRWFDEHAPTAVRCTISGYGSTGPKAGQPGYDFILQAETGLMAVTGLAGGESTKMGVPIVDISTGMFATITVLGALVARERTGTGQATEVCLHDTGIQLLSNVAGNFLATGEEAVRYGNGHANIVPYRTYRTADGELAVTVGNDEQFTKLAGALGHPEWVADPRFARNQDRVVNRAAIDDLIDEAMSSRPRAEWVALLAAAGVPSGAINSVSEALSSQQTAARRMVTEVEHPHAGAISVVGVPFQMFGTPASVRRPPPVLGAHSREVLTKDLGLTVDEVDELAAAGVTTLGDA